MESYDNITHIICNYVKENYELIKVQENFNLLHNNTIKTHIALVTSKGFVIAIDSRDPNKVKTDRCPEKFRKVLEIKRRSTSMISNDTHSSSEDSISQPY